MCSHPNVDFSLQVVNSSKAWTDARDLFIYGTNALNICYDLCANYQKALLPDLSNRLVTRGPIGDRAMAHIHGDNYVRGSELEGWNPLAAKNTLEDLIRDFPESLQKKIGDLTRKIRFIPLDHMDENAIVGNAQEIAKQVRDLKVGEDFWLEGGGNDHAMFYQFIKKSDHTYDIYIHNTGAGLEYHYRESKPDVIRTSLDVDPDLVQETSFPQEYVCPFVKYEGITETELGLNVRGEIDPALFVKLISIKKSTTASQKEAVDQIYLGCFGVFNAKRIADPRTRSDFTLMIPQRSGTCSWKALIYAALRTHLADSRQSEWVDLDLRQHSFERSCHPSKDLTPNAKELCVQGGRELQRQLANLHEVFLSQEEAEARRRSIQKALEGLTPQKSKASLLGEMPPVSYGAGSRDFSVSNRWSPTTPKVMRVSETIPFSADPLRVETLSGVEKELKKILEFRGEDHLYDLPMQIERLVASLPRPSQLHHAWKDAHLEEIKNCQKLFSKVLTLYTKSIIAHDERILSEQNTAWALLAVIHHLSGKIDAELVSKYGIYFRPFEKLIEQPTFTNFLPKDLDLYQDIVSYFKQTRPVHKLFDVQSINRRAIKYESELLPDEIFLLDRARKVPDLDRELNKKVRVRRTEEFYKRHSISEDRIEREIVLWDNDLFSNPSTAYIASLRKAAYDAQVFTYQYLFGNFQAEEFPISTEQSEDQKAVITVHRSFSSAPHKIPDAANAFDPQLIWRERNCLFEQFSHNHENSRVNDLAQIPTRLEAATCQKTLQSPLLIDHFTDNISDLSEVKNQNLFLLSLFRSFPSGMPVQEAITNPAFLRSVFQWVDKGMSLYLYGCKRPDIKTTLFFIQVIRRLKELDPSVPFFKVSEIKEFSSQKNPPERFLPDYTSEIQELLQRDDLTEEEENLLHIHRILQYSTQKTLLNNLTPKETSQHKALQEIVVSWMRCSSYKFHSWHSYHSYSEVAHFIYDLAPVLGKLSSEFLTHILNHLVPTEVQRSFTSLSQRKNADSVSPSSFYSQQSQEGIWSISPLHARILLNGEEVTFGVQKDLMQSAIYKRVFGSRKFRLTRQGSAFIFQNEKGNRFRIFERDSNTVLQFQWEGEWFQFLTGQSDLNKQDMELLHNTFPKTLLADHFVFRSSQNMLFVNKQTFAVDFIGYKGTVSDKTSTLTESRSSNFYSTIERFEPKLWILERKDKDGIVTVQFPRFKSLNGDGLEFTSGSQGLSWSGDRRFVLKENSKELLGNNVNYLLLQNGEKSKILLPCKPVAASKTFTPQADLDIQDGFRLKELDLSFPLYSGDLNIPQKGVYRFLEYNVEKGEVVPLNAEGAFFLSYIHCAQKDYIKAFQILKNSLKLKEHLMLTPESQDILLWIITHPVLRLQSVYEDSQERLEWKIPRPSIPSYDQSASATALGLRAAFFLLNEYTSPSGKQRDLHILRSIIPQLWQSYQTGVKEVDADLRFSSQELEQLKKLCNSLGIYLRISADDSSSWPYQISKNSHAHDSLAFYMEHPNWYPQVLEFKEVYNAFQRAKTVEEKTFLKMKFWKYLSEGNSDGRAALSHVINGEGAKYVPYPEGPVTKESAQEWLKQFDSASSIALLPVNTRGLSYKNPVASVPIQRPLAESLHRAKALSVPAEFMLSPLLLSGSPFLKNLVDNHFVQRKDPLRKSLISSDLFSKKPIPPFYKTAVEQERADFLQEYSAGLTKNREEIRYFLRSGVQLQDVHEQLQAQREDYLVKIKNLRSCIKDLANRLPSDEKQRTLTLLLKEGRAQSSVKMDQIVDAFLAGNSPSYSALNSHMRQEDIQKLDQLVKTFLILSIEAQQIERALAMQDPQELGRILTESIAYLDPKYEHLWRQFLVYEYRAGLRMREEQVALILTMSKEKSCVTQLMMGGGKTSVVASNLLYLAAQPGRIAFFIPPAAQFSTLIENLGNMQKKHFHQGVTPIQLQRSQLTEKNLRWVQEQFERAKKDRRVILTTRETVESLNLEYLDLLHKKEYGDFKLFLLSNLVKEMKQFGDALIDEVDLILNPMQETNFPIGERIQITPELIEMTRQLFKLLVSHERLRLAKNEQAVLSEAAHRKILLEIFTQFFHEYKGFSLEPKEKDSFLKFVAGHPASRSFQTVLKLRSKSEDLKKSADALSLTKHLSADVLPLTLSKSTGEGYGRVLDEDVVGPYHGVASPTFTEFGSQWEAMLYHFQTVLSKGVTANQVQELYESFFASASYQVATSGVLLDDTWEAKTFKTLTGYSFSEFHKPGHLELALQKINSSQDLQLLLEANTIAQVVGYYVQYLRSTSQNFVENFAGFDSFSGTPWNIETYSRSLQEGYYPDVGTEGKIIDVFLERSQKGSKIHTTQVPRPKETLGSVLQGMTEDRKKRLSGFIDSAGLFKESDGLSVAKDVLKFYEQEDRIQTVLFFGRPTPRSPMVLMALKKGFEKPIVIGSTQSQEIAKYGIALESTFVYYDQTHCEATDILQKEDAINIISVNHKMIRRSFTQGILRLRAYFKGQDIEMVLPKEEVEHFTGTSEVLPTHQDVLVKIVDNQAVKKADQTFRAYKQKIDNALRQVAMDALMKTAQWSEQFSIFERFKELFVVHREQNLYEQFGAPETWIDSLQALEAYRNWKEGLFKRLTTDPAILESAHTRLDQILDSAKKTAYRPTEVKKNFREDVGTEVEISQEVQVEVSVDHSLNQELQQELDLYQQLGYLRPVEEIPWEEHLVPASFQVAEYQKKEYRPRVYSLKDMFMNKDLLPYKQDYFKLFSENLLVSRNFIQTFNELTTVFYKKQKHAGQILIIQEKDHLKAVLLSTLEASFFKNYIKKNKPDHMWLILPTGEPFIGKSPEMTSELQDLLWQVKLLNGHVEELLKDPMTPQKRKRLNSQLLHDFLALKVEYNPKQRGVFYQHFVENSAKKKDPLSFFRTNLPSTLHTGSSNFENYHPLIAMGISKKEIDAKSIDVREALFVYAEPLKRLKKAGIDIRPILDLPCGDLVKILENAEKVIELIKKGLHLDTLLRVLNPKRIKN